MCVCVFCFVSIHLQQGVKTQSVYLNQTWANNALETRSLIGCSPAFIIFGVSSAFCKHNTTQQNFETLRGIKLKQLSTQYYFTNRQTDKDAQVNSG